MGSRCRVAGSERTENTSETANLGEAAVSNRRIPRRAGEREVAPSGFGPRLMREPAALPGETRGCARPVGAIDVQCEAPVKERFERGTLPRDRSRPSGWLAGPGVPAPAGRPASSLSGSLTPLGFETGTPAPARFRDRRRLAWRHRIPRTPSSRAVRKWISEAASTGLPVRPTAAF